MTIAKCRDKGNHDRFVSRACSVPASFEYLALDMDQMGSVGVETAGSDALFARAND